MSWQEWGVLILGVAGLLFAIYKWAIVRGDQRRGELKSAHERALKEHSERLDRHSLRLEKMDELIALTRDEMHQNYPKLDRIESMESAIEIKLERVHKRLTGISKDLNQAIGALNSRHETEIKHLVEQIKEALKK